MKDLISVIIPAHDEEKYIGKCIDSIRKQTYKNVEIIVVCDDCTDNTAKIASRYSRVLEKKFRNVSKARNSGAKEANGSILAFIDADSVMEKDLIAKVVKAIGDGYAGGTTRTRPIEDITFAKFWWWLGHICNYIYLTPSGFLFCRKDAFSGYDPKHIIGEDTELLYAIKKKGKIRYISDSSIYTSTRRFEAEGYIWTLAKQLAGFFLKKNFSYKAVR